jgi:hypothetical protein
MNDKYKKLVEELSNELYRKTLLYIANFLDKEKDDQKTRDLINLILSSHISSLDSSMRFFSKDHPLMYEKVNEFIDELVKSIATIIPISSVEIINRDKK